MCKTLIVENSATFRQILKESLWSRFHKMEIEETPDGTYKYCLTRLGQKRVTYRHALETLVRHSSSRAGDLSSSHADHPPTRQFSPSIWP